MAFLRRVLRRFVNVANPDRAEPELAREVASHLALLEDEFRRRGMPPEEARLAARRAFGGVEQAKEFHRDARSFRWLDDARRDVRYSARMLGRTPGFTLVVVLTLALGIGANTAIFSLVDAVLLRALPVDAPKQLVVLDLVTSRGEQHNFSYPMFQSLRDEVSVFSGVFGALDGVNRMDMVGLEPTAGTEQIRVQLVSGEYFEVLGVPPAVGRTLNREDNRTPESPPAAVLSYSFWRRRFAGDPAAVGKGVTIKNQPFTVVGVTRQGFFGESVGLAPDIWVPLMAQPRFDRGRSLLNQPNVGWLRVMGRLRPEMSRAQAGTALALELARLKADSTGLGRFSRQLAAIQLSDGSQGLSRFRERFSLPLRILGGVVGIILLIACANVSGLLLARATARHREVAVRLAIGAGRRRLIRQFLTESLLLAVAGGAIGLLFAWWGSRALLVLASSDAAPIPIDVSPNVRTLFFTTAVSLLTVVVFGLAPAVTGSRADVVASFKQPGTLRGRSRLSPMLVVAQVALSLLLLSGAALMVQTLRNLRMLDLGFAADTLLQVRIEPGASGYKPEQLSELSRRLVERVSAVPGVQSVAMSHSGYGGGMPRTCCIAVEGHAHAAGEDRQMRTVGVSPGYFQTMRLPVVRGRDFATGDSVDLFRETPRVSIVSEAFARRYFGDRNPVGQRFGWGDPPKVNYGVEIIGVSRNAIYGDLREETRPLVYFPTASARFLMVRAEGAPAAPSATIRQEIRAIDPNLEVLGITLVSEEVERTLVREKLLAKLSGFFGVLATVLAALGLYGLMAYGVVSRTREIGIRMAVGARRASLLRAEMQSALRLVAFGVAAGVPAALAAGRLMANQLFQVSAADPAVLASVTILLVLASAVAAYVPARRATNVDPLIALRHE